MILLHTTIYKPTAKILRAGAVRAAAAHLVGGFRPHRRPVEAFFGGRAAWPPASGVIVRPGHVPAALGVGVDRGQPRHFWRCSSGRWPMHLTLEGRAFFLAFNFAVFELATSPGSRHRRSSCPPFADCLLQSVELLGCLILAEAVELRPGGGLVDRPPWGGLDNREGEPPKVGEPRRGAPAVRPLLRLRCAIASGYAQAQRVLMF